MDVKHWPKENNFLIFIILFFSFLFIFLVVSDCLWLLLTSFLNWSNIRLMKPSTLSKYLLKLAHFSYSHYLINRQHASQGIKYISWLFVGNKKIQILKFDLLLQMLRPPFFMARNLELYKVKNQKGKFGNRNTYLEEWICKIQRSKFPFLRKNLQSQ